ALGLGTLFSPALFLLPFPVDVSLGRFFAVLLPVAALAATLRSRPVPPGRMRRRLAVGAVVTAAAFSIGVRLLVGAAGPSLLESSHYLWWVLQPATVLLLAPALRARPVTPAALRCRLAVGAVVTAAAFSIGVRLLVGAAGPSVLESSHYLWWVLQPATVLLLALVAALAMPQIGAAEQAGMTAEGPARGRARVWAGAARHVPPGRTAVAADAAAGGTRTRMPPWLTSPAALVGAGLFTSAALAFLLVARWNATRSVNPLLPLLWAGPFVLLALGSAPNRGRGGRLMRWLAAGWLAASLATPYLWTAHLDARLRAAEREIATLG